VAELETDTQQSTGSASRFTSAMRLRMKELRSSKFMPLFIVLLVFLLALFLRAYFAYDLSASNGWLMSGGSDSYYYHRLMDHAAQTGEHLYIDPMLNYPDGARNPRPPFYTFSVAAPAVFAQGLFNSLDDSLGFFFIMSSAFWGALTVIPIYLIAKEIFGRRVGYVAALFLAIMPSHVERSVATLCDHDPFALFFIVLTIYFLMKSMKATETSKWVENWLSPKSIMRGLGMFASKSQKGILYALLAGLSFAAIAMAWVGFAYIEVILLAFFLIQVLVNKFKGIDSTSATLLFFIAFGFGFLITYPVYHQMTLWNLDVPFYLFGAAIIVGVLFSVTRELPWLITLPLLGVFLAIALVVVTVVNPALGEAIFSGQGYFGGSKLYETIAEARAPMFSQLAISFGAVTFYLSIIGLILMLTKVPKRIAGDYIIISVWMAVAIFMATSAGRFMFNAAPAFAIASAWITVLIVDKLNFKAVGKMIGGSSGSFFQVLRKSVKIRHIVGALFVVFLLIVPNVWFSLDAGIPRETKQAYDSSIYNTFPDFMRPNASDYEQTGNLWYLGAFAYSLPLPSSYFPAMWSWLRQQDADILPESDRPAYVSWWDYGFEAIDVGGHPAVADNFQQGYQVAGDILLAKNESVAIGLMISRIIVAQVNQPVIPPLISSALLSAGVDPLLVKDVIANSSKYKSTITTYPDIYGSATSDITNINIMWRYLGVLFANLGMDKEVSLYKSLRDITGYSIGYIGVDARLLPVSAQNVGVFYAPVKLTDRTIDVDGNPPDYYTVVATDSNGVDHPLSELASLSSATVITGYKLIYTDAFFDTVLYKAFAGFSPSDVGKKNDGLPGYSGSAQLISPMSAWNMTHFMLAYRTAYYNPASDGSGVWQAVSFEDAFEIQQKINAGTMEGLVDASPQSAYQAGTILIKYYDGAVLSGKVTTSSGDPAPAIRVTVHDKYGIPHQSVFSDSNGTYTIILPPGEDTIFFSTGKLDSQSLVGNEKIDAIVLTVTDDMAARKNIDSDGDGRYDWQIAHNALVASGTLSGHVFWDLDKDGNYTEGTDVLIKNSTLVATNTKTYDVTYTIDAGDGTYEASLTSGHYEIDTIVNGITTEAEFSGDIIPGSLTITEVARIPASISGIVVYEDGSPASGAQVSIKADYPGLYPNNAIVYTDENGSYSFDQVLPGGYTISASKGDFLTSLPRSILTSKPTPGSKGTTETPINRSAGFILRVAGTLDVQVLNEKGTPFENAYILVSDSFYPSSSTMAIADGSGKVSIKLPEGPYSLVVSSPTEKGILVGDASALVKRYETTSATVRIGSAARVSGTVTNEIQGAITTVTGAAAVFYNGLVTHISSVNNEGYYSVYLPAGDYDALFLSGTQMTTMKVSISSSDKVINANIQDYVNLTGDVWHDRNGDGGRQPDENVGFAAVSVLLPDGVTIMTRSNITGNFAVGVPKVTTMTITIGAIGYATSDPISITTGADPVSVNVKMELSTVSVSGRLIVDGSALTNIPVEFLNATRYASFTSDQNGEIHGQILPGIYNVRVLTPVTPGSDIYYYADKTLVVYVGTDISGLDIEVEKRIKVDGTIFGVPASRSVLVQFEGPTFALLNVIGTYTTFLKEGSYVCYAYDKESKDSAAVFEFNLTAFSNTVDVVLVPAYEISGRVDIGQRSANITVLKITDDASASVVSTVIQPGQAYSVVLPSGSYSLHFEMRIFEDNQRSQRYLLMTNDTALSLVSNRQLSPIMQYGLDNSTLNVTFVDENGDPIVTSVRFGGMNELSQGETYLTDSDGKIRSTIHPGAYAIYVADTPTGLSYLNFILIRYLQPVNLRVVLTQGHSLEVAATASNSTDLISIRLAITSIDNGAAIRSLKQRLNGRPQWGI
jgi:asparagine N-glycosylation enzyme membrane subunit Stt3